MDDITLLEECLIKVEEIKEEVCDETESVECGRLENMSEQNAATGSFRENCLRNVSVKEEFSSLMSTEDSQHNSEQVKKEFCEFESTEDCENDSEEELEPPLAVFLQPKAEIEDNTWEKDPLAPSDNAGPSAPVKEEAKFQIPDALRCAEEVRVPSQQLPAVPVVAEESGIKTSAVSSFPGLLAEAVDPHAHLPAARLSHTSLCQSDLVGTSMSDSETQSSLIKIEYLCQHCNCAFPRMSQLHRHQRTGHCVLKHKCTECNFASANTSSLNKPKSKKQYKCSECNYTATHICYVKKHQRIHSGMKPFKCTECNYATAHSTALKVHQRMHSGIKPFKCTECDYAAAQSSNLKVHQRIHSGIKPY